MLPKNSRVEKLLDSDEEFVYNSKIKAVVKGKKLSRKQRGKIAKTKASNLTPTGLESTVTLFDPEINTIRKHAFSPANYGSSVIKMQEIPFSSSNEGDIVNGMQMSNRKTQKWYVIYH